MEILNGRIVAWDRAKGYGYVEAGGQRIFLHRRDCATGDAAPSLGDAVRFQLSSDRKGRACATHAEIQGHGGRLRGSHLMVLLLLSIAPAVAGWRLSYGDGGWWLLGWCIAASIVTYFVYYDDKRRAETGQWRAAESTLHLFEAIGGWPGAFLAQQQLRHKCRKVSYQFVFWFIVAAHQFIAIDYMLQWQLSRAAGDAARDAIKAATR